MTCKWGALVLDIPLIYRTWGVKVLWITYVSYTANWDTLCVIWDTLCVNYRAFKFQEVPFSSQAEADHNTTHKVSQPYAQTM